MQRLLRSALLCVLSLAAGWGADRQPIEQADRIVILKSERSMTLLHKGKVLKTYKVALGGEPRGPKQRAGDNRTPEGEYTIDLRNSPSQLHLSLHISYPNQADRERARRLGVDPGGAIMIHGLPPWLRLARCSAPADGLDTRMYRGD